MVGSLRTSVSTWGSLASSHGDVAAMRKGKVKEQRFEDRRPGARSFRPAAEEESRLLGVQYLAGDRGKHQAPFVVVGADQAPWAFAGTGLSNGSQFGRYGIEIDARTPDSPPGTVVLATIPDLFGPGRSGVGPGRPKLRS